MLTRPKINRRTWLALWAQGRRRVRAARATLVPAPVLRPVYPDLLAWDWASADPYRWNVWQSLDDGANWTLIEDYHTAGANRQFAPDGGSEFYFVVGVDAEGNEITGRSNSVRPDDAPAPAPAITLASDGLGRLSWTLNFASDLEYINIYSGSTVEEVEDYGNASCTGANKTDGGWDVTGAAGYYRVCLADENGNKVEPFSNVVYYDGFVLGPAPEMRAVYPDLLRWDYWGSDPVRWNVWQSLDDGANWSLIEDYHTAGGNRQFAPDGGSEKYFIVGVDEAGREVTAHSNVARPDDATFPVPAVTNSGYSWGTTTANYADVWFDLAFDHGGLPAANFEIYAGPTGSNLTSWGSVASTESQIYKAAVLPYPLSINLKLRYVDGTTVGPFSEEFTLNVLAP